MVAQLESSVVRIYSNKGTVIGAGFLVSQKYILTCAHVVASALGIKSDTSAIPAQEVCLDFPRVAPEQKLTARVVFWRPVNQLELEEDIAGLELLSSLPENAKPVRLLTQDNFSEHSFEAFGFPAQQPNGVWASGIIRARTAKNWLQIEGVTQTGYRLEPGFSGTPVWDRNLAGVAGMAVAEDPNRKEAKVAFIIPTDVLVKAWSELKVQAIASCPYRSLSAFKPEDEPFFFGREDMTNNLVEAVQKKPLVAVIGASGSGKSSVVFAGLIPRLYQENTWLVAHFRPSDRTLPLNSLTAAIIPLLEPQMSNSDRLTKGNNIATELRKNLKLSDVVASILETKKDTTRLLLVVDQFEELYTLCADKQEQKQFLDVLLSAIATDSHQRTSNFSIVLTLRADFFENALSYSLFAEKLQQFSPEILRPMNRKELQDAITQPAEKQGVKIQDGLTQRILEDVGEEPGNLPLLEFALTQLWEKQTNNKLTHDAYDEIGGVEKALSKHADEVYSKLTEQEQQQTQKIFIQLVRPGVGTADTRRQATRAEIGEENWNLVKYLADERLVVSDGQKTIGEPKEETVEIVHETLIREWKLLQRWMERDRAFRLWQDRLRGLILQWESKNQDEGALLRGALLAEAEDWQHQHPDELSKDERYFIHKSIDLREKEKAERNRLQQRITLGLVTGLFITVSLGLFTAFQWRLAEAELANRKDREDQENLKKEIEQSSPIPGTKDFVVKNIAVTEDTVWMAVYKSEYEGAGLLQYDINTQVRRLYKAGDGSGLRGDIVTALLPDRGGISVGVRSQEWSGVQHGISNAGNVKFTEAFYVTDTISGLVRYGQNPLWAVTLRGLCRESGSKCHIVNDSQSRCAKLVHSPWKLQVGQMAFDSRRSILWMVSNSGLIQWSLEGKPGLAKCYRQEDALKKKSALPSNYLTALVFDSEGYLWVGTNDGNVSVFSKGIETLKLEPDRWHTYPVSTTRINVLAKLPNRLLLAGTNKGLFLYHPGTDLWSKVELEEGAVQTVYDIFFDLHNRLWLATDKGLFRPDKPIRIRRDIMFN